MGAVLLWCFASGIGASPAGGLCYGCGSVVAVVKHRQLMAAIVIYIVFDARWIGSAAISDPLVKFKVVCLGLRALSWF